MEIKSIVLQTKGLIVKPFRIVIVILESKHFKMNSRGFSSVEISKKMWGKCLF